MRSSLDLNAKDAELQCCAKGRHSPRFRMAVSAAVRSTSAFGWKGDPQICAILLRSRTLGGNYRAKAALRGPVEGRNSSRAAGSPHNQDALGMVGE